MIWLEFIFFTISAVAFHFLAFAAISTYQSSSSATFGAVYLMFFCLTLLSALTAGMCLSKAL